jgi:hypothetical protein
MNIDLELVIHVQLGELLKEGKSMVRWLTFDILKSPHLTLTTIPTLKMIIKL